ncbi:fimbrial protein [Providencia rettgeri]
MRIVYLYYFSAIFCVSTPVMADCVRSSVPPVDINMELGRVVVSPELPVGTIIRERTWNMDMATSVWAECSGGTVLDAKVVASKPMSGDNIIETNVPGIGLRFIRDADGGKIKITYPGHYTVPGEGTKNVVLAGSTFTIQVIKIADVTGSGSIHQGEHTRYGYLPDSISPALITRLNADAITIVSPSCKITSGVNQNVIMKSVKKSEFTGLGSTAGLTPFAITMLCSGGVNASNTSNIYMSFNGELAPDTNKTQGVLENSSTELQAADGVGVQVLTKEDKPLEWDKNYLVGSVGILQEKAINLNYIAKYYQYKKEITPGKIQAKMIFNISYD